MGKGFLFVLLLFASNLWAASPNFNKVFIVVLENSNYADALSKPFLASLAKSGATLTNYSAIRHPSYPNYLALTSGSTQGKISDILGVIQARHIGDLLESKGRTWKDYAENYPGGCPLSNQGRFVARHVPFLSYADVRANSDYCDRHVVDSSELSKDIQKGTLPDYSFYSPNLDNDGHDTNVAYASAWLEKTFGPLLSNTKFMTGMLFVVTFDEDDNFLSPNRVLTILMGDSVLRGGTTSAPLSHYSLLRTIEDVLGLGTLGLGDEAASPITGVWK